ncbi:hypothetical protein IGI04_036440 [Brassica rapa subsp. trilocularis]|uniref:Uncharacterized protein n=1 Tax=Brassica rapa subsp. trilocularis TaxID=1813537 RepID=A0ABQ7LH69_BRACM|nr:hypothetical protein IGI04_036440 [Brassica rapa subsp. trilocularis]
MLTHKPRLDPLNIGEAKILVETELDKSFPKQITLDDKLGHKAKRCLLKEKKIPPTNEKRSEHKDMVIQVVAIDTFSDNDDSDVHPNCVTPKVPESIKAKNITSELCPHTSTCSLSIREARRVLAGHLYFTGNYKIHVSSGSYSSKDSSVTFGKSLPDMKFTLFSTLAGTSSAHTSLQAMDDVPSEIIMNEGSTLSENDPLKMPFLSTESIQEVSNMYFYITEQMDEF